MRNLLRSSLLPRRELSGSVLVVVIWTLVFFSILCLGLYAMVSSQISLVKRAHDNIVCEYLAKAAVVYAQKAILNDKTDYDTLYELRQKKELNLGLGSLSYTIIDEDSRLNLNTALPDQLARLPGLDMELVMNLSASGLKPLHAKEELMMVDGFSKDIYYALKDFITIFSDGKVNINTAPYEVLLALGLDENIAETVINYRCGQDKQEATADDMFFKNTNEILDKLRDYVGFSGYEEAELLTLITSGQLVTKSANFTIIIETKVLGKQGKRYEIVFDKEKRKQWQEW